MRIIEQLEAALWKAHKMNILIRVVFLRSEIYMPLWKEIHHDPGVFITSEGIEGYILFHIVGLPLSLGKTRLVAYALLLLKVSVFQAYILILQKL